LIEIVLKRRVLLVGAYERDNLGDLLFLLVTERYLGSADVVAAAPFSADMRAQLGRRIPAYGPLLRSEPFDAIWTVGGQVGRVDAARAYKMSARPRAYRRFERRSDASRARILRRAAGGPPPDSPYIPLPDAVHALGVLDPVERDPRADTAIVQISSARLRMFGYARVARALSRSPQLARRPVRLLPAGTATGHDSIRDYEAVAKRRAGSTSTSCASGGRSRSSTTSGPEAAEHAERLALAAHDNLEQLARRVVS
jgi:hypothetical protein